MKGSAAEAELIVELLLVVVLLHMMNLQKLQNSGRFPYGAAKQTAHKLTVKTVRGAGNGRHERDRLVVANLFSSCLIERLITIACSRVVTSATKEGVGAAAKVLTGDAQIHVTLLTPASGNG